LDLRHVSAWAFFGMLWFPNVILALGLLVAPRRMVAFLTRSAAKDVNWLRLLGFVILANTVFAVLAVIMAGMYAHTLAEFTGMVP